MMHEGDSTHSPLCCESFYSVERKSAPVCNGNSCIAADQLATRSALNYTDNLNLFNLSFYTIFGVFIETIERNSVTEDIKSNFFIFSAVL